MSLGRGLFYALFLVVLICTEFYYIEVGGGVARAYHFYALAVVVALAFSFTRLLRSSVALTLLLFCAVNLVAALSARDPGAALASLSSNYANMGIVFAVALILVRGKLSFEQFMKLLLTLTMISVIWGLMQILGNQVGLQLALSPEQEFQVDSGFGPAFRTEANTFGKFMVLPFLLFLPMFLTNDRDWRWRAAYAVMVVGILMNFTRTALIGLAAALVFAFVWYLLKGRLTRVMTRFFLIALAVLLVLFLVLADVIPVGEYARYKIDNFFSFEELLDGGSSSYRIESMMVVLDNALSDTRRLLLGGGWGQTLFDVWRQEVQAGGGDLVNILGYSGVIGNLAYLLYTAAAVRAVGKHAVRRDLGTHTLLAEGALFALVGMFVTGQMSGYLIAPEYYLLLGLCVYFSLQPRHPVADRVS